MSQVNQTNPAIDRLEKPEIQSIYKVVTPFKNGSVPDDAVWKDMLKSTLLHLRKLARANSEDPLVTKIKMDDIRQHCKDDGPIVLHQLPCGIVAGTVIRIYR